MGDNCSLFTVLVTMSLSALLRFSTMTSRTVAECKLVSLGCGMQINTFTSGKAGCGSSLIMNAIGSLQSFLHQDPSCVEKDHTEC